jgi:hypothetical protein
MSSRAERQQLRRQQKEHCVGKAETDTNQPPPPTPHPPSPQTYLPLDLRPKKTRAIRRALTKEQKSKLLSRESKRAKAFPTRKYALKA